MLKAFRDRMIEFFQRGLGPAPINEASSLHEIAIQYPHLHEFVERKYGVKVDPENQTLPLGEFVERYGLPPSQIVFMEIQMAERLQGVRPLSAREAQRLLRENSGVRLLDIREEWEIQICRLPNSLSLGPPLLDEILTEWPKDTPILVYCHYGVRSLDAGTFLADRGFTGVFTLKGGIDSWSQEIDPLLPRYQNAYC